MATKLYFSGARFNESMYGIMIAKTFDDPNLSCFSIGFEAINPETGEPFKMQTPPIRLGDFELVSNFITNI